MSAVQIPRVALIWMLLAVAGSLVLHSHHLPVWMWIVVAVIFGWRWLVYQGRFSYPGKIAKAVLVAGATAAVVLSFDKQFSLESASAFLVAACILKLLEMKTLRDGHIVVFLSYFLLAVGFLFDQSIVAGLAGISGVWLITTALIALHQNRRRQFGWQSARLSGGILLTSLPFMLVIYLIFPRLGPLWSVGLQSSSAKTGLSERMSPGDIANLSQSDELAFRVSFANDQVPPRRELYWRALILDNYDGRSWQPGAEVGVQWAPRSWQPPESAEGVLEYEIIQEATDQKWLFALRGVAAVESGTGMTFDDRLIHRRDVHQRIRYRAKSWQTVTLDENGLSKLERWRYTQLPKNGNERTRQWAQQLRAVLPDDEQFVQNIWQQFRQQEYYYTLKPPVLADNDIDAFLFDSRRGFCAHYSGALTFAARAAGIPARVVAGYQGGEWNAEEKYLSVRQYDAHAWVEVWLQGKGWVRVDPTAAVSPERVELGLEQAVQEEGTFLEEQLFSAHKLKSLNWLNQLRLQMDSINYYWQSWVLSYDNQRQKQLFQNWLGVQSYEKILYGFGLAFSAFFLLGAMLVWWNQRPKYRSVELKAWHRLQQKAAALGIETQIGETPSHYLQRLAKAFPKSADSLRSLDVMMMQALYAEPERYNTQQQKVIARAMNRLRRQLR